MNGPCAGAIKFNTWRVDQGLTCPAISGEIGDDGQQIAKWASGGRPSLPFHLVVALCRWSGEPLEDFATEEQVAQARKAGAVVARDLAEPVA